VLAEIARVVDDPSYQKSATPIQSLVHSTNGAANAADMILEFALVQK
jgi:UDP:flavonoid glycosyltransferase YjiC (YdhE family)